jgi:hypothetical protein
MNTILLGIYAFCNVVSMMDMIMTGKSYIMSAIIILMMNKGIIWKMYALTLLAMFLPSILILIGCMILESILSFLVHTSRDSE